MGKFRPPALKGWLVFGKGRMETAIVVFMPQGHLCPAHRNAVSFDGLRLWLTGQEDGISNVGGLGGHCSGRVQLAGEERKERPISELCHKKTDFERTGIKELAIGRKHLARRWRRVHRF